jgi:ABC-type thiamine transport system ATPase subunit
VARSSTRCVAPGCNPGSGPCPTGSIPWSASTGQRVRRERQRIGVARALLADRPVLLFDEPTAHLDPATADDLAAELMAATAGRTALIVTHLPEQTPGLPELQIDRRKADRAPVIV